MTLDRAPTSIVRDRETLLRDNRLPGAPLNVRAEWFPGIESDGTVADKLLISWLLSDDPRQLGRGFVVFVRQPDLEEDWEGPFWSITDHLIMCCFRMAVRVEVAVATVSLDGAWESPDAASMASHVADPVPGRDLAPQPVTGLVATVVDDQLIVQWDEPTYPGIIDYAVHIADSVSSNIEAARMFMAVRDVTQVVIPFPAYDVALAVYVVVKNARGFIGGVSSVTVTPTPPGNQAGATVEIVGDTGWSGTGDNMHDSSQQLVMIAAGAGTFLTNAFDLTGADTVGVGVLRATILNEALTWDTALFTWGGAEGGWRTWDYGMNYPEWWPARLDRDESPAWEDYDIAWDDSPLEWDSFANRLADPLDNTLSWDEADFTWDSDVAATMEWDGPPSSEGTSLTVEIQFSNDAGATWTDLEPIGVHDIAGMTTARLYVTANQPTDAIKIVVDQFTLSTFTPRRTNLTVTTATTKYVVKRTDDAVLCNTAAGSFTLSLEVAPQEGRELTVKKLSPGNTLTISGNGNDIDGDASVDITLENTAVQLFYSSGEWYVK